MKLFPMVLSCSSYLDNLLINEKQVLYEAFKKINLFPHRISCNKCMDLDMELTVELDI